jgi:hypothetical protein
MSDKRMSNKRLRADVLREMRKPGVVWLSKPVPLVPGSTCIVHGVSRDSPRGLLAYWRREAERRSGVTTNTEEQ